MLENLSNFFSFPLKRQARGGYVNQGTSYLFNNAGNEGDYWSSTPNSSSSNAYSLNFNSTNNINPSNNPNRQNGFSVRCLYRARSPTVKKGGDQNIPIPVPPSLLIIITRHSNKVNHITRLRHNFYLLNSF